MFLHDLGHALLRRWYFVVVGLLATVAGVYGIQQYVPVTYKAEASVVLVPPATAVIEGENPYLYMAGLDQALSVLIVRMNSEEIAKPILNDDPNLTYNLSKDITTTGPIILVESEALTSDEALATVSQLLEAIPPSLVVIQDALGVQENARISAMTIVQDQEATEVTKKQMRMMIAGAGGGVALTLLGTGWLDLLINKLRVRRDAKKVGKASRRTKKSAKSPEGTESSKLEDRSLSPVLTDAPTNLASAIVDSHELLDSSDENGPVRNSGRNALIDS